MEAELCDDFNDWSLDDDVAVSEDRLNLDDVTADISDDVDFASLGILGNFGAVSNSRITERRDTERSSEHSLGLLNDVINEEELTLGESIEVNPFDNLPYSSLYYELLERRRELPVWRAKDDFVMAVEESPIVLVTGRPGSGKSTQIPQWCVRFAKETEFEMGKVVCAQPCPLAAMSLAIQVAREMDFTEVGNEIGYRIPQADCTSSDTLLKFTTDELLLREMADDPILERYNFLIIDEVQERSVATDILLALFKSLQNVRDDLKIIIISQDMEKLEEFFEEVPVLDLYFLEEVEESESLTSPQQNGEPLSEAVERNRRKMLEEERMKNVSIIYEPTEESMLVDSILKLVMELHCDQSLEGDLLVFLPTSLEIEDVCEQITRNVAIKALRSMAGEVQVVSLHKHLQAGEQQNLYENTLGLQEQPQLRGRRVIISDDVAESSFCMDGISVVIDSGIRMEEVFNSRTRTKFQLRKRISRRSANLRAGRCSKTGRVYRLYSELEFQNMDDISLPSVKRVELTSHILLLKRLLQRLNMNFSECLFLDAPDPEAYMLALEELDYHGALGESGNLSDLGAVMSEFPLSVPRAKCVIASCGEDCVQEVLTIVAMATFPDLWAISRGSEENAAKVKRKMAHRAGDHFTLLKIFQEFMKHKQSEAWCQKHFLNFNSLKLAEKTRGELLEIMEKLDLPICPPVKDSRVAEISVKRALLAGYFMQVARDTDGCGNYLIIRDRHVARIHPNSNVPRGSEWIVYDEFLLTENSYVTTVSHVTASWIAEVAPQSYLVNLPDHETKDFLIQVSTRWQKSRDPERDPEKESAAMPGTSVAPGDAVEKRDVSEQDLGDVDVLTQAARGVAYAYHQASDYVSKSDRTEAQCAVQ